MIRNNIITSFVIPILALLILNGLESGSKLKRWVSFVFLLLLTLWMQEHRIFVTRPIITDSSQRKNPRDDLDRLISIRSTMDFDYSQNMLMEVSEELELLLKLWMSFTSDYVVSIVCLSRLFLTFLTMISQEFMERIVCFKTGDWLLMLQGSVFVWDCIALFLYVFRAPLL